MESPKDDKIPEEKDKAEPETQEQEEEKEPDPIFENFSDFISHWCKPKISTLEDTESILLLYRFNRESRKSISLNGLVDELEKLVEHSSELQLRITKASLLKRMDRLVKVKQKKKLSAKKFREYSTELVFDTIKNVASTERDRRDRKIDLEWNRKQDEAKTKSKGMNKFHGNTFLSNECYSKNFHSNQSKIRSAELNNQAKRPDQHKTGERNYHSLFEILI